MVRAATQAVRETPTDSTSPDVTLPRPIRICDLRSVPDTLIAIETHAPERVRGAGEDDTDERGE
jgi:hypothetical protein